MRNRANIEIYMAVLSAFQLNSYILRLSVVSFIAVLKRVIARSEKCKAIYWDNATSFDEVNVQFEDIFTKINIENHQPQVLTTERINWKLNLILPILQTAAVFEKPLYMGRIVNETLLTFVEVNSQAIEIEAILNTRPLPTLSSDRNVPIASNSGHSLKCIPDWD